MQLQLIATGTRMPDWVQTGYQEYARRLPREMPLELTEIPAGKRTKKANLEQIMRQEGDRMLKAVRPGSLIVTLDPRGKAWSTEKLADRMAHWQHTGHNLALLVGGPEGLAPACQQAAAESWSLSPLTLPHPLVRIIVAESLFRAWSLLNNHPYHRE